MLMFSVTFLSNVIIKNEILRNFSTLITIIKNVCNTQE